MTSCKTFVTVNNDQLSTVSGGGLFGPSVADCQAAFANGKISMDDLKAFGASHAYRGTTPEAAACFGKAAIGGFGFSEAAVKKTFGVPNL